MADIDVSLQRAQLLENESLLSQLPPDLLEVIRSPNHPNFLDAVAAASLIPHATGPIFVHFESLFADICARWILRPSAYGSRTSIIAAFARILPFSPQLSVLLEHYHGDGGAFILRTDALTSELELLQALLASWRLVNFNKKTYNQLIPSSDIYTLFNHPLPSVRYLAIKVLCCQLGAADAKEEALMREHIGQADSLRADFDGLEIDYAFLSLFERKRAEELDESRQRLASLAQHGGLDAPPTSQNLTELAIRYGDVVLPRPLGKPTSKSTLIHTEATLTNLESLARNLQSSGPILLHGLPGSGKTSAVHELARELGMESSLVTLHLNEQTDAKMLVGLYSTDSKPGSFSWRPGVLTTAVREGRWVLIEDLDRAPNEVMSTLLPLVEHGKLLIPSRGETIEAPNSFRLFATVRTSRGMHGLENLPSLLGQRFWQMSNMKIPSHNELEQIIVGGHPLLTKYTPMIMSVYKRACNLPSMLSATKGNRSNLERPITPRDLFKWCRRIEGLLVDAGCKTGDEPVSETVRDYMFMEAVDCFCGSFAGREAKVALVSCIAEEMHLPKQLMEHYLEAHVPHTEESPSQLKIGRVMLTKRRHSNRVTKSKKPFASTGHARRLLEQISVAIKLREPVLLVGETGIGKTTVVQQLAETLGHKLVAVNLSQQSEVGDLLGGFKPINARSLAVPLKEEFEDLFSSTGISASKNQKYLEQIGKCTAKGQWTKVSKLWREAPKMFNKIVAELQSRTEARNGDSEDRPVAKRRKTGSRLQSLLDLRARWEAFDRSLDQFDVQISGGSGSFAFAFVEGNIVKAARNGDWVLLDEINLASPDTLESVADLLASGPNDEPSILLSETGEIERVKAHPDFRIFGAMNPATDIGKRDLPLGLRSRFTELYVSSPDRDLKDLLTIIKTYLSGKSAKDDQAADDIARLYMNTKQRAEEKRLVDGANEVPHFSLRTLTRVLTYVNDISPYYGLRRALFEGFSMGFLTLLDRASEQALVPLIYHHLLDRHGNARSILSQAPKHPNDGKQYVKFINKSRDRQYWLLQGDEQPMERADYIITPYVERNLLNLVRATSTRRFPILIQGPTSAGKTSMIEYLANFSGNKFVRINNHEHTDLQEYLGTYVSDANGKLKFQEGLLVQALRQGHWIVLDELNLAPTDVLEALNRLLDDNRELLIPETQEVVRPHENFMLFATQNPPGLYGGRKVLSRAFRNRFLELHFDDIPEDELETILQKRSLYTAPSDCRRIVNVYKELSRLRQTSRLFENKDSFATLRDLFRWALRGAETREEIAANGFMLLAERVRDGEERLAVKKVIETIFKVKIDSEQLYDLQKSPFLRVQPPGNSQGVVWTHAMRRLFVLVASALRHNEPVLLVGETGCGKTTVCQLLAESLGKELHIVNAHQNTETGDLIGSQRPIRNRGAILDTLMQDLTSVLNPLNLNEGADIERLLQAYHSLETSVLSAVPLDVQQRIRDNEVKSKALFEWADGSLVQAMRDGQLFLLDEISLADDSVLERLNSVLEPQRTLLLAEKGIDNSFVKGADGFQFLATMNPGGDFGKKELSPALRNRFTEIWVPSLSESEDVLQIVSSKLKKKSGKVANVIVEFSYWFGQNFRSTTSTAFSIRDILVWVKFVNECKGQSEAFAVVHGAATVFIDTLGANPSALIALDPRNMDRQRQACLDKLSDLLGHDATAIYRAALQLQVAEDELRIGDFSIGRASNNDFEAGFALHAPTTKLNAMRIVRALQVQKPILLEGSPGVGKTTLVSALARACGMPLTRINLSDQTDLMDLFGTDVPVEGAEAGHFAWRDAPFLRAMQKGEWVLLDEMNLASQSVLEGLNACLDHRGEVYVSELDQVFKKHPNFRLFAAQNPHHQGGGRKGLPSSFVNRFIVVYADVFTEEDLLLIAGHNFPAVPSETVRQMIRFISNLEHHILVERTFGSQGSPWEFNLRDTLRWLQLVTSNDPLLATGTVDDFLNIAIRQRFRSQKDRLEVDKLFAEAFNTPPQMHQLYSSLTSTSSQVGLAWSPRNRLAQPTRFPGFNIIPRLTEIESILICVKQNLPCILVGPSGSGKSLLLRHIAALAGRSLVTFPMNADIDTMDLVGGFEQSDPLREVNVVLKELHAALQTDLFGALPQGVPAAAIDLLGTMESALENSKKHRRIVELTGNLLGQLPAESRLKTLLAEVQDVLGRSTAISNPKFEWLDGIIVQALQQGHWLVLDNANLCSASVLDRLNSLLEPNGFLIINEHCGPDGEPRIVKPHPDFRVFLTVDPRYGELSRAMRNRAIEIYIEHASSDSPRWVDHIAQIEPSMQRLRSITTALDSDAAQDTRTSHLAADDLSSNDLALLERYQRVNCVRKSLLHSSKAQQNDALLPDQAVESVILFYKSSETDSLRQAMRCLQETLPESVMPGIKALGTLHPLQDSPLVPLLQGYASELPHWVAACYELVLGVMHAWKALESQRSRANEIQVSNMNRLQRSFVADRVAAVSKDSTVGAAKFLTGVLQAMEAYIKAEVMCPGSWKTQKRNLREILHYWWRTFRYLVNSPFETAEFQAHLAHISQVLQDCASRFSDGSLGRLLLHVLAGVEECFVSGFRLTTGLSMEKLWKVLRPLPVQDEQLFDRISYMEQLASQFDDIKWKLSVPARDLSKVMVSFAEAYRLVRLGESDVESLFAALRNEMERLQSQLANDSAMKAPFMADEFEAIRQISTLDCLSRLIDLPRTSEEMVFLSNLPLSARLRSESATDTSKPLLAMETFFSSAANSPQWNSNVSSKLFRKLPSIDSASLGSLSSLEKELPILARQLGLHSEAIASDRLGKLSEVLWRLMLTVANGCDRPLAAICTSMREASMALSAPPSIKFGESGLEFNLHELLPQHIALDSATLTDIVDKHLLPAVVSWAAASKDSPNQSTCLANAWIQFAVALVKLFVPDKAMDPQLRPQVALNSYQGLYDELERELQSLQQFELVRTGGTSNVRCRLLREDIDALGPPPTAAKTAYRPLTSELSEIQGEFNGLLKVVLGTDLNVLFAQHILGSAAATQQLQVIRENISRISSRLSQRFRAYEDIIRPTVNILHCLELGISLGEEAVLRTVARDTSSTTPSTQMVPFLDGDLNNLLNLSSPATNGLDTLAIAKMIISVEGPSGLQKVKRPVFEAVHSVYGQWTQKLEQDRESREAKEKLFRYRGGADDEEAAEQEAFGQMFPSFDDDQEAGTPEAPKVEDARGLAIKLAQVHKEIFLFPGKSQECIEELALSKAKHAAEDSASRLTDRQLLSATLLAANQRLQDFTSTTAPAHYNFYSDGNMPEARKLVSVVNDIRGHFLQLQQVDEIAHMQPLADVVANCDAVLELSHSDPLAKIIPKVERLHGFVYEWQFGGWASKVYGDLPSYNRLTDLLVSWRRLELSTWSKLLDMEVQKCDEDACSWWFIAYQAIIAGPMALVEAGENMQTHAAGLLRELETYFSSAPVGQFGGRLNLLKQLQKQLAMLVEDVPSMSAIHDGLQNFIDFYSRYEKAVSDRIRAGKAPIEKQMKEILLLASWKDTNIVALRESARKSHQKLFRIVRKFRELLAQPLRPLIEQGLPGETHVAGPDMEPRRTTVQADQAAMAICRRQVPAWSDKYKRLANVGRTVEIMTKFGRTPDAAINVSDAIDTFLADLTSQAQELRKETPGFLSDENKDLVKHLKTRKRKLFAETLKTARHMGFQYNLATEVLARQDTLSTVLAATKPLLKGTSPDVEGAVYYFHKMLDLLPRVRSAAQGHSDDLTSAEVLRSIGFLEGILHATLKQSWDLSSSIGRFHALSTYNTHLQTLCTMKDGNEARLKPVRDNHREAALWLRQILLVGTQVTGLHATFSGNGNEEAQSMLKTWCEKIDILLSRWNQLSTLPDGLVMLEQFEIEKETEALLTNVRGSLTRLSTSRPDLAFIFEQIQLWTCASAQSRSPSEAASRDITALIGATKQLCDTILVAIEKFGASSGNLPVSTDQAGWLVKYNEVSSSSTRTLHIRKVESSIADVLGIFKHLTLEDTATNRLATSIMSVVAPIVDQYQTICRQWVIRCLRAHQSTCKLGYTLSENFTQLASRGFCTPQEKSEESGQSDKLEEGTGLGEGEGAEDISKDIQPDEDLSELAQEGNKESGQEMEDEKDAVDMADEDLQGDDHSAEAEEEEDNGSKSGDDEDNGNELDEEAGDVDDLDPTAVDEKMWDGDKDEEEAEKDQQGDNKQGQKKEDEQAAADQKADTQDKQPEESGDLAEEEPQEDMGAEQEEDVQQQDQEELNRQDQNVQEQDALALPDDMDIDGNDDQSLSSISDDDLDKLSDVDQGEQQDDEDMSDHESNNGEEEMDVTAPTGEDDHSNADQEPEATDDAKMQEEEQPVDEQEQDPEQAPEQQEKTDATDADDTNANADDVAPSDVKSGGQDADADCNEEQDESQNNATRQDEGQMGENAADQDTSTGQKGSISQAQEVPSQTDADDAMESSTSQPFKALGDALEKWHRQRRDIKEAQEKEAGEQKPQPEQDTKIQEFQHLENDDSAADAQAMGAANEEQTQPIDDTMAVDEEEDNTASNQVLPPEEVDQDDEAEKMDTSEQADKQAEQADEKPEERRTGVSTHQGTYNRQSPPPTDGALLQEEVEDTIQETSTQLSTTHLSEPEIQLRDFGEALQNWTDFQSKTHPLSLSLTSQLRLILTPSQSTKLSGSYRTGKRLNIKRIIPYIASSYKRDKIWMRRAIPTKRSYQILLCVDDSKSMGESSSGELALESLVMVSRALSMLEVGQIGVLGFGANVFMAHEFTEPFASHDAGAKVLQKFSFQQDYTDIQLLIRQTIERFRLARLQGASRGSEDLWQLALILSDGLTPSSAHEEIRVLLREAMEERIMIVFIVMDDTTNKKDQSVLTLKKVRFMGNDEIKTEYYLDTFPFQYYLIVHNLEDLPGALAGLLRTWFAEVNA
ncbi:hypothetical protein F4780DRAFT_246263 [Xylariomycetidae sp. FL0641]|nr:hypothetical protein F4780DRAFT_246263 [Xylariomycetidae sp. FL0641]